jgi:hypothetical protein
MTWQQSDIFYITSFRALKVSEQINGHVALLPGVNITNDPSLKRRFLTPEFVTVAGTIEASHLEQADNLVFGEIDPLQLQGCPEGFLLGILLWISDLFKNAWLLKDHAMECDAVFLHAPVPEGRGWFTNFLAVHPTFANGQRCVAVELSINDLQCWARKHDQVEEYLHNIQSGSWSFMMGKGYSRPGRALQFISAARSAPNTAFKLAHYCSALETLFTTESTELAHKLSERVGFFLGGRGYSRHAVFTTVKAAYNMRSKLVHGDTLKQLQIEQLPALSLSCDEYLRTILNAIFDSENLKAVFDAHNNTLEDYFSQLIFGELNTETTS